MAGHSSELIDQVVAAIGEEGWLALALEMGGALLYVPRAAQCGPDHLITLALGPDRAAALCRALPGATLQFPIASLRRRYVRRYAGAQSAEQMARRLKCPRSTIYRLLNERVAHNQLALF